MSKHHPLSIVVWAGLLVALVGCSSWREWRRQAAIETIEETVAAQRAAMTIVAMKHGTKPSKEMRLRVLVTPDAVHVDNGAWLGKLEPAELEALDAEANGELVVHAVGLTRSSAGISEAVARAIEIEKLTYASLDTFVARAELVVDEAVPFLTLAEVLAGVAKGGVQKLRFAVMTKDGERFFNAESPTPCAQVKRAKRAEVGLGGFCAVPEIEVRNEGLQVRTRRRAAQGKGCAAELERGPEKLEWDGRVMLPDAKACPSVPMTEDGHDAKGLIELLNKIAAIVPGCTSAVITAGPGVTWGQAASVVVATTANSPFPNTALLAQGAKAPGADLDCSTGMSPQDLPAVAERLAKAERAVNRLSIMGHLDDLEGPEEE